MRDDLKQRTRGQNAGARGERGLRRIALRQYEGASCTACGKRHGERAAHRAQLAGQRKLAGKFLSVERRGRELAARGEDPERDRQIEAARVLRQLGRREIDRDAARGKLEMRMVERGPYTVACLAHLGIRESDDMKCGQTRTEVNLHGHLGRVDTGKRAARHRSDRHMKVKNAASGAAVYLRASSSAMRASSSASLACARSSSFFCTSKSSRSTRSMRSNHAASRARMFFSTSFAGESRSASSMRLRSSSKRRLSIIFIR